jgi:signal transduction histidine kinase/ActR/RegA family two-component response regulator
MRQDPDKRILLIHGDPAVRAEFRRILCLDNQEEGGGRREVPSVFQAFELDAVSCGGEGLALAREALEQRRPYSLAVVDVQGTGEPDGMETVRRLWGQDAALCILICTVGDQREITRQFRKSDRLSVLSKPPKPEELRQLVTALVDGSLTRRRLQEVTGELDSMRRELERARDEAKAAGRAKTEFMANVSHEIRTPMNAIIGFTRLLMKEPLTAEQSQKLRYVHEAGTSLLSLINNLLDYSKLSAGQMKLCSSVFNLDALLGEALAETRALASKKGLAIRCHVVEAVPRWLRGDKHRFGQVLVSLVGNAIKFTEHGTIHLQVTLDEQTDQTATLRVVVTDTGVGIPVERQAVIFESFSQADGSATRQFGGVGLGLSICKQLVDLMGGQVGFRSDSGGGSSFWLTLAFPKHRPSRAELSGHEPTAPLPPDISCPSSGSTSRAPHAKPHVLVAEADHLNRTLAEMLLGRAGCLVDLAESRREALAMLKKTTYDLLLADVEMFQADGLELIEQIGRREQATGRRLPVVVPTVCTPPDRRQQRLVADTDEYVSKPFTPEELINTVRRHFPDCLDRPQTQSVSEQPWFTSDGPSDRPQNVEDYLQPLCEALEREDFHAIERRSGALKGALAQIGCSAAVDQAMRVQLAARSCDLKRAASAIHRLRAVLQEEQRAATEVNSS